MATPKETFRDAVKARINGNKAHGWGADDSMHVISELFKNETGEPLDEAVAQFIRQVVNPSAFRQKLEDAKVLEAKPTKISGVLAEIAS